MRLRVNWDYLPYICLCSQVKVEEKESKETRKKIIILQWTLKYIRQKILKNKKVLNENIAAQHMLKNLLWIMILHNYLLEERFFEPYNIK